MVTKLARARILARQEHVVLDDRVSRPHARRLPGGRRRRLSPSFFVFGFRCDQACRFVLHIVVVSAAITPAALAGGGRKSLFSARWDVSLGLLRSAAGLPLQVFCRGIKSNRFGLNESPRKRVLDFGLADQQLRRPPISRCRRVDRDPASAACLACDTPRRKLGIGEREHRTTPLTLFWVCHHGGSQRGKTSRCVRCVSNSQLVPRCLARLVRNLSCSPPASCSPGGQLPGGPMSFSAPAWGMLASKFRQVLWS